MTSVFTRGKFEKGFQGIIKNDLDIEQNLMKYIIALGSCFTSFYSQNAHAAHLPRARDQISSKYCVRAGM